MMARSSLSAKVYERTISLTEGKGKSPAVPEAGRRPRVTKRRIRDQRSLYHPVAGRRSANRERSSSKGKDHLRRRHENVIPRPAGATVWRPRGCELPGMIRRGSRRADEIAATETLRRGTSGWEISRAHPARSARGGRGEPDSEIIPVARELYAGITCAVRDIRPAGLIPGHARSSQLEAGAARALRGSIRSG